MNSAEDKAATADRPRRTLRQRLLPMPWEIWSSDLTRIRSMVRSAQKSDVPESVAKASDSPHARFEAWVSHFGLTDARLEQIHERIRRSTLVAYALSLALLAGTIMLAISKKGPSMTAIAFLLLLSFVVMAAQALHLRMKCYQIRARALVSFATFVQKDSGLIPPARFRYMAKPEARASAARKN